ncbi:MAG: hypothetical protein K8W52_18460 [Deltaproteobacteria bacterium]|nr:hypothetical protein [Deltaproteobacteria bacterium]
MRTSILLALAPLVACGSSSKSAPVVAAKPPVVAPAQPAAPPAPPAPPPEDPAIAKKKHDDEALARVQTIKTGLSALRDLAFKQEVPAQFQSTEDFRTFVSAEVKGDHNADRAPDIAKALLQIGLLASPVDLNQTLEDAMVTQAAAYYDPKQKKFFIVMVPADNLGLDTIAAHELTHALQDQYFDLTAYLDPKVPLNDDQATARKFVVEGEATLTMFAYAGEAMAGDALKGKHLLDPAFLPMLKPSLTMAANMTIDDFKAMTKQQALGASGMSDDIKKSLDAMDTIPPVILVPMMDSYMKGSLAVLEAFQAGGWAEVAKLYSHPPDSTEQVLHPDTKLYPKRDVPKKVTLPTLPGYTEVYGNTLGELEWRIYFGLWNKDAACAIAAAAGWDGDHWSVVTDKSGGLVGLIATTWDTASEAKEFATAYQASVAARFPNQERTVWVKTKGANVYIVDGGTDATLIDKLVKGAKVK